MNRLASERSPYLLQHASNPVEWYPWGEEAFEKARREDRPVFLSIGYSTCHWCHVMEHESFEDAAIAELLNRDFVPIKVDREERPDIDRVYMTFVQATTGAGGWPMSVWLTPDLKPFFGGTYFPPTTRWGRPGFVDVLTEVARVWKQERYKVQTSAETLVERLKTEGADAAWSSIPSADRLVEAVDQFSRTFDSRHGGFGDAPKFPRPVELLFLLREHARTGDETAGHMVLKTLHAMATGGMRDHVGGGFHRYSVDAQWRVPHFEKMLYDQAQLTLAYLEAAQSSGAPFYAHVAEDTLQYVGREMTDPEGGFYSAEDADSLPPEQAHDPGAHKMEGAFYLWTDQKVTELLGPDAEIVKLRFGIQPDGNAPEDPHGEFAGKNLLYTARSFDDIAKLTGRSPDAVAAVLDRARPALLKARLARPRPHLDDKVLAAWNGLMIAAFARAARILPAFGSEQGSQHPGAAHLAAAQRAARFIKTRMWNATSGTLSRRYRAGEAGIEGYAEDYAFLIFGLLELFQSDVNPEWLDWALELQQRQDALFWDQDAGGWFSTTGRDPSVLLRMKEDYDGAEPSAGSVSVWNLLILSHLTAKAEFADRIDRTLRNVAPKLPQFARTVPMMLAALSMYHAGMSQAVIVGPPHRDDTRMLLAALYVRYMPFAVLVTVLPGAAQSELSRRLPWIGSLTMRDGMATAYVCRDFVCDQPTTSVEVLLNQLAKPETGD